MTVKSPMTAAFVAPAFPTSLDITAPTARGLTKREYFAISAFQAYLSNPEYASEDPDVLAVVAVSAADELLTALTQTPSPAKA